MSYSPATKLSHSGATQCCTVLTNGNIMVTRGLGAGSMMKLEDWQILADGAQIYEDFIPVAAALSTPPAPPAVVGAKFRWTLDANNYRVAIMTAKGLLEVKSVINGETSLKKTLFADEAAWRATVPLNGTTELSLPAKLANTQRAEEAFPRLNDVEKIQALLKRYKITDKVWEDFSPKERLENSIECIKRLRQSLNTLTLQDDLDGRRQRLTINLRRAIKMHYYIKSRCDAAGDKAGVKPIYIKRRGTGKIQAIIGGTPHIVTIYDNKIATSLDSRSWSSFKLYKDFAEMGNPQLSVIYRGRKINL